MSDREAEYQQKGVEFLAVNAFEDPEAGREWIASSDLHYRWAFADAATLESLGVNATLSQILLDREGKVVWVSDFGSVMSGADSIFDALDAAL